MAVEQRMKMLDEATTSMQVDEGDETQKQGAAEGSSAMPWVEKYRPKTVDEVSSQAAVVKTLKKAMQTANVSNCCTRELRLMRRFCSESEK